jgi:hypothetical protein
MDDAAFREEFKPVHVPAAFAEAKDLQEKVVFALASLNEATADQVSRQLEELAPETADKELIAGAHRLLTELYEKGLIAGQEQNGGLVFNLHKITAANDGAVDPELLAPGLDQGRPSIS